MGTEASEKRGALGWLRPPPMTREQRGLYALVQESIVRERFRRAAPFGAAATLTVSGIGALRFAPDWRAAAWAAAGAAATGLLVVHGFLMPRRRAMRIAVTAALGLAVAASIDILAIPTGGIGSPAFPAIMLIWLYGSVVAPLSMREILFNVALELLLAIGIFAQFGPGASGSTARAMTIGFVGVGFVLMVLGTALRERGTVQAFLTQQRLDEANRRLSDQSTALEQLNGELERRVEDQVAEIRARARDVELLNRQLQERVVERSRELAAALERLAQGAPRADVAPGNVLIGRFEIVRPIGAGGMGEVFEGIDRATGARVAVKVIHGRRAHDLVDLQRFLVEARAAAAISHEGIVRTLDVDVTPDGTVFQVMELLDGTTMEAWIAKPGSRSLGAVAAVGRVLADALAAAHRAGVVHRDVKPGNVMLGRDGSIKVLDFGLSKIVEAGASRVSVTHSQMVMGTPAYMAPEQFLHSKSAGSEADVYSLGVVLYEALTGVLPFQGETNAALFVAHTEHDPMDVRARRPEVPQEVAAIVMRCLEKDLRERPHAADVASVLVAHARPEDLSVEG
ncbi:MAG TPA: protein kinase, partial [Polyangiaceae bacterium]